MLLFCLRYKPVSVWCGLRFRDGTEGSRWVQVLAGPGWARVLVQVRCLPNSSRYLRPFILFSCYFLFLVLEVASKTICLYSLRDGVGRMVIPCNQIFYCKDFVDLQEPLMVTMKGPSVMLCYAEFFRAAQNHTWP